MRGDVKSVLSRQAIDAGRTQSGFHPESPWGTPRYHPPATPQGQAKPCCNTTRETIPLQGLPWHASWPIRLFPVHCVFSVVYSTKGAFQFWTTHFLQVFGSFTVDGKGIACPVWYAYFNFQFRDGKRKIDVAYVGKENCQPVKKYKIIFVGQLELFLIRFMKCWYELTIVIFFWNTIVVLKP